MPYDLTFPLGPLTVTVGNVPDAIDPRALSVDVALHPANKTRRPDGVTPLDALVTTFDALGGVETFPNIDPASQFSVDRKVRRVPNGGEPTDGEPCSEAELRVYLTGIPAKDERATLERIKYREAALAQQAGDAEARVALDNRATKLEDDADQLCGNNAVGAAVPVKPMLATDKVAPEDLRYPVIAQPKLDGIRATVQDGVVYSRTLKLIPNQEIQAALGRPEFEGLDGEIIVGDILAEDAYRKTTSFVMDPNKTGEDWVFHVFDVLGLTQNAAQRNITVARRCAEAYTNRIRPVMYTYINDADQLAAYEQEFTAKGGEGIIVRNPSAPYKNGRAGKTKQELVKVKPRAA